MEMSEQGRVVYERTYSRTKPDGTKETWPETVERVVDGNLNLADRRHELPGEREDLIRMMTEFKIIPAGRHLWASGVPGRQYLFNCHVSGWTEKPSDHFEFTFLRLMEGGGVGANYSNKHLVGYPTVGGWVHGGVMYGELIPDQSFEVHIVCDPDHPDYQKMKDVGLLSTEYVGDWSGAFEVEDSREGWASALVDLIDTYYRDTQNQNRVFDVSRVRAEGARLKTFGGRASGPMPLAAMLREVAAVLNGCIGQKLDGISAMRIDHAIAKCVVSGGNRRSARMAIMHWADPQIFDFLICKQNTGEHWTTNISVEVDEEFWASAGEYETLDNWSGTNTRKVPVNHATAVLDAIAEGMLKNGEPGFWNSSLSNVGEPNPVQATNPCFHPDTVIETVNGPRRIADITEPTTVYTRGHDGKLTFRQAGAAFVSKRDAETVRVGLSNGDELIVTPDHRVMLRDGTYIEAATLKPGDRLSALCRKRAGNRYSEVKITSDEKFGYEREHRAVYAGVHGPIPDKQDVDHIDRDTYNNDVTNLRAVPKAVHGRKSAGDRDYGVNQGLKDTVVENPRATHWGRFPKVAYVVPGPVTDVYDISVEDTHNLIANGVVAHNCGEIALESWEPCNLGHVNLAAFVDGVGNTDYGRLRYAHQLMTRFLIRATYGDVNDPKQAEKLARNRRIGVGHLGVASYLALTGRKYSEAMDELHLPYLLSYLSNAVDQTARDYAHDLRIPVPVKTRTVAPTGTIAKMPGVSEGIHPIFSKYFIRRIRFSTVDPDQVKTLADYEAAGYHVEDDQYASMTKVVSLPTKDSLMAQVERIYGEERAEEIVESAADLSLDDMLGFQRMYQTYWADNAVSYTVNVDPNEYTAEDLARAIHQYGPDLKGATVFPEMSMPQSPYERISKADYALYEYWQQQVADGVDEACANGACPIK